MVRREEVPSSSYDEIFRAKVTGLLGRAKKEVFIVTGEWRAFKEFDLRSAVINALERGIKIKVYLSTPHYYFNLAILEGAEVYKGKKTKRPHFMVVDKKAVMTSEVEHKGKWGKRQGHIYTDRASVEKFRKQFTDLIKKAKPLKPFPIEQDPIYKHVKATMKAVA